jgi:hypothetical protein
MATKTWTLLDLEQDVVVEQILLGPDKLGEAAAGCSVAKRVLQAGPSRGVDVVEVNNGAFRFVVVPTRGMGIWRASLGNVHLGWSSPVKGPVHPGLVRLWEPSGLGWLDGFDELLCRCGLESNGAPEFTPDGALRYPLHGRIANTPAHRLELAVDDATGQIALSGTCDEARLFGNKLRLVSTVRTSAGRPGMTVTDQITNLSAEPAELELLYHINFGTPLLGPGARVVLPAARIAPRDDVAVGNLADWDLYGPETPGSLEAVFFAELQADAAGDTQALLHGAAGDQGVSLRFNRRQFPCFTLWKNRQAAADGYVTGLEPGINFPNPKSFERERGRVAVLPPGASRSFEIEMEVYADRAGVSAAEKAIDALRQSKTEILDRPDPEWSSV